MTCDTATALTRTAWPMAQLHEHLLLAIRKLREMTGSWIHLPGWSPSSRMVQPYLLDSALGKSEAQCAEQKRANHTSFRRGGPEQRRLIPDYWPSGSKPGAERQGVRARQDNSHQEACGQGSSRRLCVAIWDTQLTGNVEE